MMCAHAATVRVCVHVCVCVCVCGRAAFQCSGRLLYTFTLPADPVESMRAPSCELILTPPYTNTCTAKQPDLCTAATVSRTFNSGLHSLSTSTRNGRIPYRAPTTSAIANCGAVALERRSTRKAHLVMDAGAQGRASARGAGR
jgi:hypothetical protein